MHISSEKILTFSFPVFLVSNTILNNNNKNSNDNNNKITAENLQTVVFSWILLFESFNHQRNTLSK